MGRAQFPRHLAARRGAPLLIVALATCALLAPAAANAASWQEAKQDIKTAAHETGHAIVNGAHAAGHAIRHAAQSVGQAFHHAVSDR